MADPWIFSVELLCPAGVCKYVFLGFWMEFVELGKWDSQDNSCIQRRDAELSSGRHAILNREIENVGQRTRLLLRCPHAALILYDDGIPITAEKIATIVKAANVKIDSYWPGLFAELFEKKNIEDLIFNVGSGGAAPLAVAASAAGGAAAPAAAPAAEEKKEEAKEESDDDMGFSLFD